MSTTSSGSDVLRTLLVCITVVIVSCLGYSVISNVAKLTRTSQEPPHDIAGRSEEMSDVTRLSDEIGTLGHRLDSLERSIEEMKGSIEQWLEPNEIPARRMLASVDRQDLQNRSNILSSLQAYGVTALTDEGVEVNIGCLMLSPWQIEPPFTIAAEIRSDAMDVRLHATGGYVIFNWAVRPDDLPLQDPATGKIINVPGKGKLPQSDEWVTIAWTVARDYLQVRVGDQEVFRQAGDYSGRWMQVGFGTYSSKAVVRSFLVTVPDS